ncbi:hypothetical protein A3Q56_01608 [Intoshia linei]|uniref:Uncharacterized protein n=1 Tax=Intoshia linei TaxID=1819745 RepID=A0A177BAF7_9BILA|nr:hypothetical protein A3Q56_01608 [Intoshia linei]
MKIALEKYPKAKKCFLNHWNFEPSIIKVPRTNIVTEQCIKVMTELWDASRSDI